MRIAVVIQWFRAGFSMILCHGIYVSVALFGALSVLNRLYGTPVYAGAALATVFFCPDGLIIHQFYDLLWAISLAQAASGAGILRIELLGSRAEFIARAHQIGYYGDAADFGRFTIPYVLPDPAYYSICRCQSLFGFLGSGDLIKQHTVIRHQ